MTDKQIKSRITRLNKKLSKIIDKFVNNIEQSSIEFRDLFPDMKDEDFKTKSEQFKAMLMQCILTPENEYDSVVSEIRAAENRATESKKPSKIEIINMEES